MSYRRKLSAEKQQQIIDMLGEGASYRQIAKQVGCSWETVQRYRSKTKVEPPKCKAASERRREIAALVALGMTRKEIAKHLGLGVQTIRGYYAGKDTNAKPKKRKPILHLEATCKICSAPIVCEVTNHNTIAETTIEWSKMIAECSNCGQAYPFDILIDKLDLERAWWDGLVHDDSSVGDPRTPPRAYVGRL